MSITKTSTWTVISGVIWKIIKCIIALFLVGMSVIAIDGIYWMKFGGEKAEYAVVYWSKVWAWGLPSPRLQARLDTAIDLLDKWYIEKIIVSGGTWNSGYNEAIAMKFYLLFKGVKIPRIIVDENGNTTMKTSQNVYDINTKLWKYPNVRVIWVSQFFHLSRVKLSLKKVGFIYVDAVAPDYHEWRDIYALTREVPAYIKYVFMGIWEDVGVNREFLLKLGQRGGDEMIEIKELIYRLYKKWVNEIKVLFQER